MTDKRIYKDVRKRYEGFDLSDAEIIVELEKENKALVAEIALLNKKLERYE